MYVTQHIYGRRSFFETIEEAEKDISECIDNGDTMIIAEVKKVFKTDPVPYKAVDITELKTKKLIEQEKEED